MELREWLKRNWMSVLAILISMVALFRCEPFIFTESWLNWSLGIIVGVVGIAVSVALVVQIWTAVQVDKMMDSKIDKTKTGIEEELKDIKSESEKLASVLENKSFNQATSVSMYVMGQLKALTQDYNGAFFSFLLSIKSAKAAGLYAFCDMYAEQTLSFLSQVGRKKTNLYMSSEEKDLQIKDISGIPDSKSVAALIRFIASLPESPDNV